jgi:hypothetical protein
MADDITNGAAPTPFICCENDPDCIAPCEQHPQHDRFRIAAKAVVKITDVLGLGCAEDGSEVKLAVRTLTQDAEIVLAPTVLDVVITNLITLRNQAQQQSIKAGEQPRGLSVTPVQKYAIGSMMGIAGVIVTFNHGMPHQEHFLFPEAKYAADFARGMLQEAGNASAANAAAQRSKGGILLPGLGAPMLGARRN